MFSIFNKFIGKPAKKVLDFIHLSRQHFNVSFYVESNILKSQSVRYGNDSTLPTFEETQQFINDNNLPFIFGGWQGKWYSITKPTQMNAKLFSNVVSYEIKNNKSKYDEKPHSFDVVVKDIPQETYVIEYSMVPEGPYQQEKIFLTEPTTGTNVYFRINIIGETIIQDFAEIIISDTRTCTVRFLDWDGSELKKETVAYGSYVTAPASPVREGYTFKNWDKSFDIVTTDLDVNAVYEIKKFTVTFKSADGVVVKTQTDVEFGTAATAPQTLPSITGYHYNDPIEWDTPFDDVRTNLVVNAVNHINQYEVKFFNYDDTQFGQTQIVNYMENATNPGTPTYLDGWEFNGWYDQTRTNPLSYLSITENKNLYSKFTDVTVYHNVKFYDSEGMQIGETQIIKDGQSAIQPSDPIKEGYQFISWDKDFTSVKENLDIYPIFKKIVEIRFVNIKIG